MNKSITSKNRKEIENKLAKVFEKDLQSLPTEFKKIMVSDLLSAFESRLCVLSRARSELSFSAINEREVQVETI